MKSLDIESVQQKDKTKDLQKQCVIYFDVWSRVLENQQKRWKQDKLISQPLFEENNLGGTLAKGLSNVGLHRVTEALAATDLI